ncbi:hypothetical protein HOLleu_01544 [Holothuria leucospilota]|uniref:Uncharacterized protein n=1 Tax=Holothuria leucospilota TaxID=206669 RepID=A0A9Q1CNJ9_HOLLE|nr:hypothetical protein HOLleu_01544 [Holothuria leucospilota]
MRNFGNYLQNDSVLREGKGTLIVVYRPQYTIADPNDYLPCHERYGYYAKSEIWKHACPSHESRKNLDDDEPPKKKKKKKKRKRGTHCKKGKNLLPPIPGVSSKTSAILLNMSNDSVAQYCRSDSLIRMYADKLREKHGHDADQTSYIRQVRELGRLMLEYRSVTGQNNAQLSDILSPANLMM